MTTRKNGPGSATGTAPEKLVDRDADNTVTIRRATPEHGATPARVLHDLLDRARREGDDVLAAICCAMLDTEYVRRSFRHRCDPEIIRLRKQLRAAS
jgi:hypothetical protein